MTDEARFVEVDGETWRSVRVNGVSHAECPRCETPLLQEACDDCAIESGLHRRSRGSQPRIVPSVMSAAAVKGSLFGQKRNALTLAVQEAMSNAVKKLMTKGVPLADVDAYRTAQLDAREATMDAARNAGVA